MKSLVNGIATLLLITVVITAIPEASAGYLKPVQGVFIDFKSDIANTTKEKLGFPTGVEATIVKKANNTSTEETVQSVIVDLFTESKGTPLKGFTYTVNYDNDVEKELANGLLEGREAISVPKNDFTEVQMEYTLQKVLYQNPLIMYVDSYWFTDNTFFIKYKIGKQDNLEKNQLESITAAKNLVYTNLTEEMSEKQRVSAIVKGLFDTIKYNDAAADDFVQNNYKFSEQYINTQNVYGALVKNDAVCSGFAKSFKLIADSIGIENQIIIGAYRGVPHIWNMVNIDGEWYYIDSTNCINELENSSSYATMFGRDFDTDYQVQEVY